MCKDCGQYYPSSYATCKHCRPSDHIKQCYPVYTLLDSETGLFTTDDRQDRRMTTNQFGDEFSVYYPDDTTTYNHHTTPTTNQHILHRSDLYDESEEADREQTPSISYVIHNLPNATEDPEITPQTPIISTLGQIRELPDQLSLLIDTGSVNNLAGSEWVTRATQLATEEARLEIENITREEPLEISGVGTDSLQCKQDVRLPITLQDIHGENYSYTFTAPVIDEPSSTFAQQLPALLGSEALIQLGIILDFRNMRAHFAGPIDIDGRETDTYTEHLPTGTRTFELQQSPTGHIMIPCSSDITSAPSNSNQAATEQSTINDNSTYGDHAHTTLPLPATSSTADPFTSEYVDRNTYAAGDFQGDLEDALEASWRQYKDDNRPSQELIRELTIAAQIVGPSLDRRWEEALSSTETQTNNYDNQTNDLPRGTPGAFGMPPGVYFQDQHITNTTYTIPTTSPTRRGKGTSKRTTQENERINHSYAIFKQRYSHFELSEEQLLDLFHWSDRQILEISYERLNDTLARISFDYFHTLEMQRPFTDHQIIRRFLDHRQQVSISRLLTTTGNMLQDITPQQGANLRETLAICIRPPEQSSEARALRRGEDEYDDWKDDCYTYLLLKHMRVDVRCAATVIHLNSELRETSFLGRPNPINDNNILTAIITLWKLAAQPSNLPVRYEQRLAMWTLQLLRQVYETWYRDFLQGREPRDYILLQSLEYCKRYARQNKLVKAFAIWKIIRRQRHQTYYVTFTSWHQVDNYVPNRTDTTQQ